MRKLLMLVGILGTFALSAAPADARGGHAGHGGHGGHAHGGHVHHFGGRHGHFFRGPVIVGSAGFYGAPYYSYHRYAYPSDVVMPTLPLYGVPLPGECRAFQGDAVFAGTAQPFYGTACFAADGRWHIVS